MKNPGLTDEQATQAAEILKSVAHPVRLRIVALLSGGEQCVNELAEALNVEQPVVSQQLRVLRMQGLVARERRDGFAIYSLAEPRLRQLLSCIGGCIRSM